MTEEELEKKAEEYASEFIDELKHDIKQAYKDGYKQGQDSMLFEFAIEDRNKLLKEIEEQKKEIEILKTEQKDILEDNDYWQNKFTEIDKERAELKKKIFVQNEIIIGEQIEINELKADKEYLNNVNEEQMERILDLSDELKNEIAFNENSETVKKYKAQIEAQKAINLELVEDNAQIIGYNKKMRNCANCTRNNCKGLDGTDIILIKHCIDNNRQLWEMRT